MDTTDIEPSPVNADPSPTQLLVSSHLSPSATPNQFEINDLFLSTLCSSSANDAPTTLSDHEMMTLNNSCKLVGGTQGVDDDLLASYVVAMDQCIGQEITEGDQDCRRSCCVEEGGILNLSPDSSRGREQETGHEKGCCWIDDQKVDDGGAALLGFRRSQSLGCLTCNNNSIAKGSKVSHHDQAKKAMAPEKLAELWIVDPKRAKRILANRQSAARSKERKARYVVQLEKKVQSLHTQATSLAAQLSLFERDTKNLAAENTELRRQLETMEQQARLRDDLNEALEQEIERLKLAIGEALTPTEAYMVRRVHYIPHEKRAAAADPYNMALASTGHLHPLESNPNPELVESSKLDQKPLFCPLVTGVSSPQQQNELLRTSAFGFHHLKPSSIASNALDDYPLCIGSVPQMYSLETNMCSSSPAPAID